MKDHGVPVEGVIDSAVEVTVKLKPTRLGLIGGRRTVVSGVYRRAFAAHNMTVHQRIAQPLSGLIESGDISSEDLRHEARRILTPIRNSSHILLACTHYPAIEPLLKELVSPTTQFIDPAGALLKKIARWRLQLGGDDIFVTTGDAAAMKRASTAAFGVRITNANKVRL